MLLSARRGIFINISANWEVIDSDLSQGALLVNDEETSEGKTLILLEDSISPADSHALVSKKRNLHLPKTPSLAALLAPGQVGEVGVGGARDDSAVNGLKLSYSI